MLKILFRWMWELHFLDLRYLMVAVRERESDIKRIYPSPVRNEIKKEKKKGCPNILRISIRYPFMEQQTRMRSGAKYSTTTTGQSNTHVPSISPLSKCHLTGLLPVVFCISTPLLLAISFLFVHTHLRLTKISDPKNLSSCFLPHR